MTVFITGISKGLGLALAREYARRDARVYGISRSTPPGLPNRVRHQCIDITAVEAKSRIEEFVQEIGSIDLLINNAGCGSRGATAAEVDLNELSHQIQLHCIGALRVTQALLPKLHAALKPKIINVTSRLGSIPQHLAGEFEGRGFSYAYRIAKSAQNMLTVCMQGDRSLADIIVAALNPGLLKTDTGTSEATHSAREAARNIVDLIAGINTFGVYHAFNEPAYF